jgi:signal transduction histidine kinase
VSVSAPDAGRHPVVAAPGAVRRLPRPPASWLPWARALLVAVAGAAWLVAALVVLESGDRPSGLVALTVVIAIPTAVLAFHVGALRSRDAADSALQRVAACAAESASPAVLRGVLADALHDPSVEIVFPTYTPGDGWLDAYGRPVALPEAGSGRRVQEVHARGVLLAAIVHDERLRVRPDVHAACADIAGVLLDNRRLAAEAALSLCEVRRSRARIAASAAHERRRIQRDLHDGAQQRLVALRIELDIAQDLVRRDPEQGARLVRDLGRKAEEALDELRALAHGVYPALLADRGLAPALRAAAAGGTGKVEVQADGVPRYSTEIESAVYFCVLEALQNVAKHAGRTPRTLVRLEDADGELRFTVRDEGGGTHDGRVHAGTGITNMRDRLAALSGDVAVTSPPGAGTTVNGRVPTAGHTGA